MGLKKDAPPEVEGEAGQAPAAVPTPPPEQPPTAAAAPTPPPVKKKVEKGEKTVMLLAVRRPIGDPFTGVLYDMIHAKPGVRKKGNWVDCQIVAGILAEK